MDQTVQDATISGVDGESHGSAAMPIADFQRYLQNHAIRFVAE